MSDSQPKQKIEAYEGPQLVDAFLTDEWIDDGTVLLERAITIIPLATAADAQCYRCRLVTKWDVGRFAGQHRFTVIRQDAKDHAAPVIDTIVTLEEREGPVAVRLDLCIPNRSAGRRILWVLIDAKRAGRVFVEVEPTDQDHPPAQFHA